MPSKQTVFLLVLGLLLVISQQRRLQADPDPNCAVFNENHECQRCVFRFILVNGTCFQVSNDCKTWDANGDCVTCYEGWGDSNNNAINGECQQRQLSEEPENRTLDVHCQCHDENRTCIDCFNGYYLDQMAVCQLLPENCTAAAPDGNCTQCENAYILENGTCVLNQTQTSCDLSLCQTFTQDGTQCQSCPARTVYINGCCVEVDGNCRIWDPVTGECFECYGGYKLDPNNSFVCILA